jgi:TonB family protein
MRVLSVLILLLTSVAAFGQQAAEPCPNMVYPVNRPTNKPPVPPSAWRAPQAAVVWVDLTVDNHGNVKSPAVAISGGKDADEAVLKAVRNWSFQPAMCGLQPVETRIHIKVNLEVGKPGTGQALRRDHHDAGQECRGRALLCRIRLLESSRLHYGRRFTVLMAAPDA